MATADGDKTGGRQAGTENKFTGTVKETVLEVFQELGGKDGLLKWVKENKSNRRIFYTAFIKSVPRELFVANGDSPESLPFRMVIESEKEGQ